MKKAKKDERARKNPRPRGKKWGDRWGTRTSRVNRRMGTKSRLPRVRGKR